MKYEPPTCVCGHLMVNHAARRFCLHTWCLCASMTTRTVRRHWLFRWRWIPVTNDPEKATGE